MNEQNSNSANAVSGRSRGASGRWNPYWVGVGLGVLSWMAFAVVNQPLGITTALSSAASLCVAPVMGADGVAQNAYWARHPFKWDGGVLFLVGTFLGSLLSALSSRTFRIETVPATWAARFGAGAWPRILAAFIGGIIIMYGARMAGGCTSGHGISGSLQLALSSWTFFLTMFAFGALTALIIFRQGGKNNSNP